MTNAELAKEIIDAEIDTIRLEIEKAKAEIRSKELWLELQLQVSRYDKRLEQLTREISGE